MSVFEDIAKNVTESLNVLKGVAQQGDQAARQAVKATNEKIRQEGGTPREIESRSYMITNNDTGEDSYIKVYYDPVFNDKVRVEEYIDGKVISHDTPDSIKGFFNDMQKQKDISVFSAPVDVYEPSEWPEEYNDEATVFYDSTVDGKKPYANIFSRDNYGVRGLGNRKSKIYRQQVDQPNYQSFEDRYRDAKRQLATRNNTLRGAERSIFIPPMGNV